MAEIHVGKPSRSRALIWAIVAIVAVAAAAWFFLAGPGVSQ
jgi:hypothetical protein